MYVPGQICLAIGSAWCFLFPDAGLVRLSRSIMRLGLRSKRSRRYRRTTNGVLNDVLS
jgi:hypothetical protein